MSDNRDKIQLHW